MARCAVPFDKSSLLGHTYANLFKKIARQECKSQESERKIIHFLNPLLQCLSRSNRNQQEISKGPDIGSNSCHHLDMDQGLLRFGRSCCLSSCPYKGCNICRCVGGRSGKPTRRRRRHLTGHSGAAAGRSRVAASSPTTKLPPASLAAVPDAPPPPAAPAAESDAPPPPAAPTLQAVVTTAVGGSRQRSQLSLGSLCLSAGNRPKLLRRRGPQILRSLMLRLWQLRWIISVVQRRRLA